MSTPLAIVGMLIGLAFMLAGLYMLSWFTLQTLTLGAGAAIVLFITFGFALFSASDGVLARRMQAKRKEKDRYDWPKSEKEVA